MRVWKREHKKTVPLFFLKKVRRSFRGGRVDTSARSGKTNSQSLKQGQLDFPCGKVLPLKASSHGCGLILLNGVPIGLAAPSPPVALRGIAALVSAASLARSLRFAKLLLIIEPGTGFRCS